MGCTARRSKILLTVQQSFGVRRVCVCIASYSYSVGVIGIFPGSPPYRKCIYVLLCDMELTFYTGLQLFSFTLLCVYALRLSENTLGKVYVQSIKLLLRSGMRIGMHNSHTTCILSYMCLCQ